KMSVCTPNVVQNTIEQIKRMRHPFLKYVNLFTKLKFCLLIESEFYTSILLTKDTISTNLYLKYACYRHQL
ncbi:MAG: hypothetical protein KAI29_22090, partial [Cyclobacteriaceae bacterium]|nr:hypothetical protein [Cyclobacteriaceae bacterium]